jgi:hypothetical protein
LTRCPDLLIDRFEPFLDLPVSPFWFLASIDAPSRVAHRKMIERILTKGIKFVE